jgi:hypothetical protein
LSAITVLGLDAAGLPHAYARLATVCHSSACAGSDEVLSPGDVGDLRELGISLDFYAGLTVGLSTLGTVVFAATAAAIFFRRSDDRVQDFIDRRFYRKKYDAAKTLEAFSARLREETDLDRLGGELVSVAHQTIQPEHASLWLKPQGEMERRER